MTAPASQLPPDLLAGLLDDPRIGLLVLDRQMQCAFANSQARDLLRMPAEAEVNPSDLRKILEASGWAKEYTAAFESYISQGDAAPSGPAVLNTANDGPQIRLWSWQLENLHRAVAFEPLTETASHPAVYDVVDSLTGLASRRSFENALKSSLAERPDEPLAVMLLDLDRFKAVNDTLGHPVGDAVLRLAAERIQSAVRKTDLVARLGGDEFAVLIYPALSSAEPAAIAARIIEIVQRTYLVEGHLVNIGTSIGIALSPGDGAAADALMRSADLALYHSKTTGRGTFTFFNGEMEARANARRTNELELRRAIALRQLELHYQPQVNIANGRLVGFEALVRWRHPVRGLIPPSDFLPLAEEIGIIIPLGEWVLRTACRQAMSWPDDVVVAVNASPLQFDNGRFADTVCKTLKATGLPGTRLEIEITEGILLRSEEAVLSSLHALRDMGVRIAMDDFGTGYASLSQLARFPFDKIKIDKSLAGFEGKHPKNRAIVRAIASLGESLGVSTMAEGVETAEQLERLQTDGCKSVQGYLFSKPLPADELQKIISRHSSEERQEHENTDLPARVL